MTEAEEQAYVQGERSVWNRLLDECLHHLDYGDDPKLKAVAWIKEREEIVAQLRILCDDFGDNDWEPDCHLGDVIANNLGKYLHSAALGDERLG